ncbi:MAG: GPR endopeptidase [Evtepia sp.]
MGDTEEERISRSLDEKEYGMQRMTDLAWEAKEMGEASGELQGVRALEETYLGLPLTRVEILDARGARSLGKPCGTYVTLALESLQRWELNEIRKGAAALAGQLRLLLPKDSKAPILVIGLGNSAITSDAIGPKTMESILVTRHLVRELPESFGTFREVAALTVGVLGSTGLESGELVRAAVDHIHPACVIAVDALAARALGRVCTTIQLANTGITPGSGVGNHRMALSSETLGVPVLALGVPTVVQAATLCADLLEELGQNEFDSSLFQDVVGGALFVTPKDIDSRVKSLSHVLGLGISMALQVDLSAEDVEALLH